MKKAFLIITGSIGLLIALFVIIGLLLPNDYRVERRIIIDALPAEVEPWVSNLRTWNQWEPWTAQDSTVLITSGETSTGVGASQTWTGIRGDGSLVFTDVTDHAIYYDMSFGHGQWLSKGILAYQATGTDQTEVRWVIYGEDTQPILGAYNVLLMDSLLGPVYDTGLQQLKQNIETPKTRD